MLIEELLKYDIYSPWVIMILIGTGFLVGFINTLAGSGTIISYSVFMALGLPATYANGTIRIGVILQTLASSIIFKKNTVLDLKKGLKVAFSTVLGSIIGAQVAVNIDPDIFKYFVGSVMLLMLFFLFFKPNQWIEGRQNRSLKINPYLEQLIYLGIGFYGGFIHIGVGFFLLAALVLISGYDLLRANALKVFLVMLYSPFALIIYLCNDQVHYAIALITAIGNVMGGILASKLAISWGTQFIHWFLLLIIILFTAKVFGLFDVLIACFNPTLWV